MPRRTHMPTARLPTMRSGASTVCTMISTTGATTISGMARPCGSSLRCSTLRRCYLRRGSRHDSDCVPAVMDRLQMLSLEIQRMPRIRKPDSATHGDIRICRMHCIYPRYGRHTTVVGRRPGSDTALFQRCARESRGGTDVRRARGYARRYWRSI